MYLSKEIAKEMESRAFIAGCTTLFNTVRDNPNFYHVPIEHLDTLRKELRLCGYRKFRARFRGQRNHPHDFRCRTHRYQDCAKQFARSFTVYFD